MAAFGYSGQVVAAETNKNSSYANTHSRHAPKSDARAPIIIQVEPSAKEVEAEAERQAAERKIFGLETDQWIALFTLVLGVSTILLWLETRRLAEGDRERYFAAHGPKISMKPVSLHLMADKEEYGIRISMINTGNSAAIVYAINTSARIYLPSGLELPQLKTQRPLPFRINAGQGESVILLGDDSLRKNIIDPLLKAKRDRNGYDFSFYIVVFYKDETGNGRLTANMFKFDYLELLFRRTNDPDLEQQE